jgi:hypothetical protein
MQTPIASGRPLLVATTLLLLGACGAPTLSSSASGPSASGSVSTSGVTRVAGAGGMDAVTSVSDALGNRLDAMLGEQQIGH